MRRGFFVSGLCAAVLVASAAHAIEGHFRVSEFGNGHQIWFEANFWDERFPDEDQYYTVVAKDGAYFGDAVNRTSNSGGYLRYTFDLTEAGGVGGTWYFWAREINPNNESDYMLVEGDPGDPVIPTDEPIPGGDGAAPFDNGDDRIFEENVGTPTQFAWGRAGHGEGHTKELQDGQNSMFIFHRQGSANVFWDVFMWTDDPGYAPTDDDYLAATLRGDVGECPADGDTHCHSITVLNPDGDKVEDAQGNRRGRYTVTVEDSDDSGDDGLYTLTADNGVDPPIVVLGSSSEINVRLTEGTWTISVSVDDDILCQDEAEDATCTSAAFEVTNFREPPKEGEVQLIAAFHFGSRRLECQVENDPSFIYETVYQGTAQELAYDEARGWGYEVTQPGAGDYFQFGPFDASANNRTSFPDTCPEELYDSFIGAKDFPVLCDDPTEPDLSCEEIGVEPNGIIFRADVPEGRYRFVAVVGSADNPHAHRILAENGGEGPPVEITDEHVVLVNNFDQGERGAGIYAHVGFDDYLAPQAVGPGLVSMDSEGFAIEDEDPDSPILEVTEGYIRIHQLQGNSWTAADRNGGDMVLLELWRLPDEATGAMLLPGDVNGDGNRNIADAVSHLNSLFSGGELPACYVVPGTSDLTESGLKVLDFNGDGASNIADPVASLGFQFGGGMPPALGAGCVAIEGPCTENTCN